MRRKVRATRDITSPSARGYLVFAKKGEELIATGEDSKNAEFEVMVENANGHRFCVRPDEVESV